MVGNLHFYLRLLLYLVAFFYIVLTVITIVKNEITSARNINMTRVKERLYKIRIAVCFFVLGWLAALSTQFYHVHEISQEKGDGLTYIQGSHYDHGLLYWDFYNEKRGDFSTTFCYYDPPFRRGLVLIKIVYKDEKYCWNVEPEGTGFVFLRDKGDTQNAISAEIR